MVAFLSQLQRVKTLRPRQDGRHFPEGIFNGIFVNETVSISINISLKFVPKSQINTILALVQIMACRWPGDKPLSEPMIVLLLTHICVTRPQWVNAVKSTEIQSGSHFLSCLNVLKAKCITHGHPFAIICLLQVNRAARGLYDSGFGPNKGLPTSWTVQTSVYAIDILTLCHYVILHTHVNLLNKRFWIHSESWQVPLCTTLQDQILHLQTDIFKKMLNSHWICICIYRWY